MAFRFRRRAPAIIVSFAALVIFTMTVFVHELSDVMVESAEASNFRLMRNVLADVLEDTNDAALARAELISSLPAIRTAFAERDRARLHDETKAMFAEQRDKYGVDEGQFLIPPGTSFLRLHAPETFGDDQSKSRPILADVFKAKAHKTGVVLGPTGVFVTAVVPMEDMNGETTGAFEIALEFAPVIDEMKDAFAIEGAYFIDERMLRDVGTQVEGDVLSEKNRVDRYIRMHATHDELLSTLVKGPDIAVRDASTYSRVVHGRTWGVALVPLYDHANHPIGVFAMAQDFSDVVAMEGRAKVWQFFAAFVSIVLIAGVVLVVIRGVLLRPLAELSERMHALADGDASRPAVDPSTYCEELEGLAKSYERLRTRTPS